jgi:tetratricopeptide (TPR) repeat protein
MLFLFIQSCAGMKRWVSPKSPEETSTAVKAHSQTSRRTSPKAADPGRRHSDKGNVFVEDSSKTSHQTSSQTDDSGKKYMKRGEYQEAIDTYDAAYRKHPHDEALLKSFVKSIEYIKSTADKASEKDDLTSAAKNYDLLVRNYSLFKEFEKMLSFNIAHLDEKLCNCKMAITKKGFQEYRKGNLSGAILLWEGLLAIDPDNTDIRKSLRTAKLQQKNLEEK